MNATINDCRLYEAMQRSDKKRTEIPHIVQVFAMDFDTIVMAAEIRRLHKAIRDLLENGPEIGDGYASELRAMVYGDKLPSNPSDQRAGASPAPSGEGQP